MSFEIVQSLATSDDADVREIAIERTLRQSTLTEEGKLLLRENLPNLSHNRLIELLARHGDLGCPALVVQRLVDEMPRDQLNQFFYVNNVLEVLSKALDADVYADFVEKVLPMAATDHVRMWLVGRLRGCPLFDAIAKHDSERPEWLRGVWKGCLTVGLLDVRREEPVILGRLGAQIARAKLDELLGLHGILAAAGCADLASQAWARSLTLFAFRTPTAETPAEDEASKEERDHEHWVCYRHWERIVAWVSEASQDHAARIGWLADRVAELERSGWHFQVTYGRDSFPKALVDEIANILIDRGEAPDWAGPVLRERLATGSLDAWTQVFAWWPADARFDTFRSRPYAVCKAMMTDAPLPVDAPDEFDEALLRRAHALRAYERKMIKCSRSAVQDRLPVEGDAEEDPDVGDIDDGEIALVPNSLFALHAAQYRPLLTVSTLAERLLQMRLTPARARRIARMIKGHRALLRNPRIVEIAEIAGPLDPGEAPTFEEIDVRYEEAQVYVYRTLGGVAAEERLRQYVRASFEEAKKTAPTNRHVHLGKLGWRVPWVAELTDDDLRDEMKTWASGLPLTQVLHLRSVAPWLVDEDLVVVAAWKHLQAGLRWDDVDLPAYLLRFIEERARKTEDDRELVRLIRLLEHHGVPQAKRLDILLARLAQRPTTPDLTDPILPMFATRTSWENHGPTLLRALMRWSDWRTLGALWLGLARALGGATEQDARNKLMAAVHLAFATVLLELAGAAADGGDEHRLGVLLTAVLKLDPPPPIVRELLKLERGRSLSERAIGRIDAGMKLFKSMEGREPSFDALFEAMALLANSEASTAGTAPSELG